MSRSNASERRHEEPHKDLSCSGTASRTRSCRELPLRERAARALWQGYRAHLTEVLQRKHAFLSVCESNGARTLPWKTLERRRTGGRTCDGWKVALSACRSLAPRPAASARCPRSERTERDVFQGVPKAAKGGAFWTSSWRQRATKWTRNGRILWCGGRGPRRRNVGEAHNAGSAESDFTESYTTKTRRLRQRERDIDGGQVRTTQTVRGTEEDVDKDLHFHPLKRGPKKRLRPSSPAEEHGVERMGGRKAV